VSRFSAARVRAYQVTAIGTFSKPDGDTARVARHRLRKGAVPSENGWFARVPRGASATRTAAFAHRGLLLRRDIVSRARKQSVLHSKSNGTAASIRVLRRVLMAPTRARKTGVG
jgi:hypothetical protein